MLKCKEELIDILMCDGKELLEVYDHSKGTGGGGGNFFKFIDKKKIIFNY